MICIETVVASDEGPWTLLVEILWIIKTIIGNNRKRMKTKQRVDPKVKGKNKAPIMAPPVKQYSIKN